MEKKKYYFRLTIAVLGIVNLLVFFSLKSLDLLVYYTLQSNLIVSLWYALWVFYYKKDKKPIVLQGSVKGAITLYITVTWLIYMILLDGKLMPIDAFFSSIHHYIIPLAVITDWFLFEEKNSCKYSHIPYWLIYPFSYLAFAIIRGQLTGKYPYFFIDLSKNSFSIFLAWLVAIVSLYILLGFIYIGYNTRFKQKS